MNILILFATLAISITVAVKDFEPALGKWKGTITYLDYTSGKHFTMPCNITIRNTANEHKLIFALEYPEEPQANGNDTLIISADGTLINDTKVVAKENKDGLLQITSEKKGLMVMIVKKL